MASFYFRSLSSRHSLINGPFSTFEAAHSAALTAGLKAQDIGFWRKEGPTLSKVASLYDDSPLMAEASGISG